MDHRPGPPIARSPDPLRQRPASVPHLWTFMSREEFALCYGVTFVTRKLEYLDCYQIDRYPTPGEQGKRNGDVFELVKRAIRFLSFEHGMRFERLVALEGGEIGVPVGQPVEPLCPPHNLYVSVVRAGGHLNVDFLLPIAIRHARRVVPSLPVQPMENALSEVEELLAARRAAIQPEVLTA